MYIYLYLCNMGFWRDIVLNIVLLIVFLVSIGFQTGVISPFTHTQVHEKSVETIRVIDTEYCVSNKRLKSHLDLNIVEHEILIQKLQKKSLILHYDCGFKNTLQGNFYS